MQYCENYETTLKQATDTFIAKFTKIEEHEVLVSVALAWVNNSDKLAFLASYMTEEDQKAMEGARVVLQNMDWSPLGLGNA